MSKASREATNCFERAAEVAALHVRDEDLLVAEVADEPQLLLARRRRLA
jgi:hypothetical protein